MSAARRIRLWSLVIECAQGEPVSAQHVCAAVIAATRVDSGAITMSLSATPRETIFASDPLASELEELALTLGEGPTVDAFANGPALIADLAGAECAERWPAFAPAAVTAGVHAVFALPLQVGAIRLGVLSLYRRDPGDLDPEQLADAFSLVDTACGLLLDAAEGHSSSTYPSSMSQPGATWPEQAVARHPEVHQATGMITVQLGVSAAVALIRLRAHAFASGRRLRDVAGDVVSRRLRFDIASDADGRDG